MTSCNSSDDTTLFFSQIVRDCGEVGSTDDDKNLPHQVVAEEEYVTLSLAVASNTITRLLVWYAYQRVSIPH